MGWEQRGTRRYYYRKRRTGERVVSEYVGAGALAALVAECDALDRCGEAAERAAAREASRPLEEADQALTDLAAALAALTRAVLLLNDYHPHQGQWRRTRATKSSSHPA